MTSDVAIVVLDHRVSTGITADCRVETLDT